MNRWLLAALLLAGSVAVTTVLFLIGLPFFFLFLFIPLIPFLGKREIRRCPRCGWETAGKERFCPWDGATLEVPARKQGKAEN